MTYLDLINNFPTEQSCIDSYLKIRYPDGIRCNHCGSSKVYQRTKNLKAFTCNDCYNSFSPFTGTLFEKSSTDLRKWLYAIYLFVNSKKSISGVQLQREIGVMYKTAWRMKQKIRLAMVNPSQSEFFNTIAKINDTCIIGKTHKENEQGNDPFQPLDN
jgi:transposase-like protein